MRIWKIRDNSISFDDIDFTDGGKSLREDVVVCKHYTFRITCCSRGVTEHVKVILCRLLKFWCFVTGIFSCLHHSYECMDFNVILFSFRQYITTNIIKAHKRCNMLSHAISLHLNYLTDIYI